MNTFEVNGGGALQGFVYKRKAYVFLAYEAAGVAHNRPQKHGVHIGLSDGGWILSDGVALHLSSGPSNRLQSTKSRVQLKA
jgi:hypothetical protein